MGNFIEISVCFCSRAVEQDEVVRQKSGEWSVVRWVNGAFAAPGACNLFASNE